MNQPSSSPLKEVEIDPSDLLSLGSYWKGRLAALSPLERPAQSAPGSYLNPVLFGKDGSIHAELQPVLDVLANPWASAALMNITTESVIDWIVYHAANGQAAAVSHVDESYWLQQPPPIPGIVQQLRQRLLPGAGLDRLDWRLARTETWVLWAAVDLLYGQETRPARFSLSDLSAALDLPLQGIHLLAAHFRDSLQLPIPPQAELLAACDSLVGKGLLGKMGTDYLAGDELQELARQLDNIHWYTTLRISSELQTGEVALFDLWLLQWDSGQCLAWYVLEDQVVTLGRQPEQLIGMLESALLNPGTYFKQP